MQNLGNSCEILGSLNSSLGNFQSTFVGTLLLQQRHNKCRLQYGHVFHQTNNYVLKCDKKLLLRVCCILKRRLQYAHIFHQAINYILKCEVRKLWYLVVWKFSILVPKIYEMSVI